MIFSVIVPFFNEESYIEQCVQALVNQDFKKDEYELIFVDNNSSDKSSEIIQQFPEIILLSEEKKGAYAARNKGLEVAKGYIIAFTDADCRVEKDWLTNIYEGMNKTDAAIVLGKTGFPSDSSYLLRFFEDYDNAKAEYVLNYCENYYIYAYGGNMAVKTEVFQKIGFFKEWLRGGDVELVQRYLSRYPNAKVTYLSGMKILHLEVRSLKAWLKKMYTYGQAIIKNQEKSPHKPLTLKTNFEIYKYCIKQNGYSFLQSIFFLFLLIIGYLAFWSGVRKGTRSLAITVT
jgi:glycosyltransferase involved in cell wall biosynthesis